MSNFPVVSVIMSVYNAEKYISEAIQSILIQTYSDFEFIIIDDGSTDDSLKIIKKNAKIDERINFISRENKGLVASLNEGILKSKGKYIVRMDADDISLPNRILEQVTFMETNQQVGVCGTWIESFVGSKKGSKHKYSNNNKYLKARLLFSTCFAHPSVIIRKSVLIDNNLFYDKDYLHAEDFEFWTRLANVTHFSNINKVLLKYRIVNDSVTHTANKDYLQRYQVLSSIFNKYLNDLKIENDDRENYIHFVLSVNTRIRDADLSFKDIDKYFNKIVQANIHYDKFDKLELNKTLGKKWLWNLFYKREVNAIFSKYFFYGVFGAIFR